MAGTKVLTPPIPALSIGQAQTIPAARIRPNPWNPNQMDEDMIAKERQSIEQFGFVVPIIVRETGPFDFQIVDGEHRWVVGQDLGMTEFPCWNLGIVDEDTARQLTIVLNETRGTADEDKLAKLVQDLLQRRDERGLRAVLPFDRERFDRLAKRRQIDWEALEAKRQVLQQGTNERWVERVFRMPSAAAIVVDQAIQRAMRDGETEHSWRALELIAADYVSG